MACDELTGQVTAKKVTHKFVEWHDDDVREITVSNGLIETVIITSDEHPFYVLNKGVIPASELKTKDQLVSLNFNVLKIISNKRIEQSMPMYNLEVEDYHTYAVSNADIWVHNHCRMFEHALNEALDWLEKRGFKADKVNYGRLGDTKGKAIGMVTKDGKTGFRIEYDDRLGAHINVFSGKEKGPHFKFDANAKTVSKLQKLFEKIYELF